MGIAEIVHAHVTQRRRVKFEASPQLTLGQLIDELDAIPAPDEGEPEMLVSYDFCGAYPTSVASWRGAYEELAIGWAIDDGNGMAPVSLWLERLRFALGKTFTGYKGGDYVMTEQTPVWVANWGESGDTAIVGVLNVGWGVVIQTAFCEY